MKFDLSTIIENPEVIPVLVQQFKPAIDAVVAELVPALESIGKWSQENRIARYKRYEEALGAEAALALSIAEINEFKQMVSKISSKSK